MASGYHIRENSEQKHPAKGERFIFLLYRKIPAITQYPKKVNSRQLDKITHESLVKAKK